MKKLSKGLIALIAVAVLAVILIIWGISTYNGFVSLSASVDSSQADINTQLKRRADLIPNLVATVQGYTSHENDVIKAITDARAKLAGATTNSDKAAADDELTSALSKLTVVVENYPDLKSSENYRSLQDELAGTENRINFARQTYNAAVKQYNTGIRSFPGNIIAGMCGFSARDYFQVSESDAQAPTVSFAS